MKVSKKWKKAAAAALTAVMLTGNCTMPVLAHHGHSSTHHSNSSTGVYCSYHNTTHKSKSSCKKYCKLHKTTHKNGKKHVL